MLAINNVLKLDDFRSGKLSFKGADQSIKTDPLNRDKVELKNVDTIGWVLSGGGAKGVFEIGVACALTKAGMIPDVIVGTSVGALNAMAMANGDVDNAVKVWKQINKDKVYKSKVGSMIFKSLGQILNWIGLKNPVKVRSILDNTPLRKLVKEESDVDDILDPKKKAPVELMLGVTALNNGKEGLYATPKLYEALREPYEKHDIYKLFKLSKENFEDAVIASTSIPLAFPAVQIDDEVFVDGGAGNNTPAKNGVDALFAINGEMKEGLLFVVLLGPQNDTKGDKLDAKNADLAKVGIKTLNLVLDNTAKMDVKMTQKITEEIERWDVININLQEALTKIGKAAVSLQEKAAAILQIANMMPDKEKEAAKLRKIAEEISKLSGDDIENSSRELSDILNKYKPFDGKKKIKLVIIRPKESFGVDTLEFDKAGQKADEVIQLGYDAALDAMMQSGLLKKDKYDKLKQEKPYPVGNIFKSREEGQQLSEVV